jgi:DNA-binding NtrC family response regulator
MIASLALGSSCPRINADAERLLTEYAWPGNVRELRNVAERLALASGGWPLTPDDLPEEIRRSTSHPAPESAPARDPHQPGTNPLPRDVADRLLGRMGTGEDFWTVVHQAFKAHELTKADLLALVDAGLRHTHGSYRALLPLFNLPATDYKRLHAFLHQQRCNLPVATYRQTRARRSA